MPQKRRKTVLRLPPISTRNPKALATVVNNAFASAVLRRMEPNASEWAEWLAVFGANGEADLACVYCGRGAELLDHLNPTIIDKKQSGFFAELGNLVPACRPCNESRGNKPWESWMRTKHAFHGEEVIEERVSVMRRFEQWSKPERLDPRSCGDPKMWDEYDLVRREIHGLLSRAQAIADDLRAAVTEDLQQRRRR
jgi:hypothetical protein